MDLEGRIKVINDEQVVSASFKKRELVITTDSQYPQHILVEFHQDKCAILDGYKVGESVKVSININGRLWTNPQGEDKYFNSINGWRIERTVSGQFSPPPASAVDQYQNNNNPSQNTDFEEEHDDLPFG